MVPFLVGRNSINVADCSFFCPAMILRFSVNRFVVMGRSMANVTVEVVCPCGALLMARRVDPASSSKLQGRTNCPCCKQSVEYTITNGKAFTAYVK